MFCVWAGSGELFGLCFRSGDRVCGAKYWKLWYRIPWCMLTLAAAKGFWGCFYCTSVSTTHHLLRLRRRKHREDIVMHLWVKTYLQRPRSFQRKHSIVGAFFLSSVGELCFMLAALSPQLQGAHPPPQSIPSRSVLGTCTSDPAISNRTWVSVQTTVRKRGELQLSSGGSWGSAGRVGGGTWAEGRAGGNGWVSKHAAEQITRSLCLLLGSPFTCAHAFADARTVASSDTRTSSAPSPGQTNSRKSDLCWVCCMSILLHLLTDYPDQVCPAN